MTDYQPYTDDPEEFDFERAKLLLDIIVSAGQHGPTFQKIVGMAQKALKEMVAPPQPKTVMPEYGGEEQLNPDNPESAERIEEQDGDSSLNKPIAAEYNPDEPELPEVTRR